jgi:hypothetical protein
VLRRFDGHRAIRNTSLDATLTSLLPGKPIEEAQRALLRKSVMATIVQLSAYARKAPTPKAVLAQGAKIILFHGIRYERWEDKANEPIAAAAAQKPRRRKARKAE